MKQRSCQSYSHSWERLELRVESSPVHSTRCFVKYPQNTEDRVSGSPSGASSTAGVVRYLVRGSIYRTVVTEDEVSWHIIVTPDLWWLVPPTPRLPAPALPRLRGTAPGQPETDGGAHTGHHDAAQSPGHAGCQALPAVSLCPQESVTVPLGIQLLHHAAWPQSSRLGMKICEEWRQNKVKKMGVEWIIFTEYPKKIYKLKSLTSSK